MRTVLSRAALALALVLTAASARAAEPAAPLSLGAQGQATLGVERLFGLDHTSIENGSSITSFSILGSTGLQAGVAPYSLPRLAFDYFVAERVSVGTSLFFAVLSPENGNSVTSLGFNPRVGYAIPVGERVTFWPTAGLSLLHVSSGSSSNTFLAATVEPRLVVALAPHLGFLVAGTLDLGLNSDPQRVTEFGLQCGLTGWF